jgi:hypothetical protein
MASTHASKSAAIRARLGHPVIDSDEHTIEFFPAVLDYLHHVGGPKIVERYKSGMCSGESRRLRTFVISCSPTQ